MLNTAVERTLVVVTALLMCAGASPAADLHPIVEVESGYLFGAISVGKWIKADETAKLIGDETTYRVYGLTQTVSDAKGDKPKPEDVPCEETLAVALSPQPEHGVIAIAAPWNALPRKPKVKIDNIVRVDLDGDGEEEVLISATNYFRKEDSGPMRSARRELFNGIVAARGRWKSGNAIDCRRILSQGLSEGRTRRGTLRRAKRVQSNRHARPRWRRQNGSRHSFALLRRRRDNDLSVRS